MTEQELNKISEKIIGCAYSVGNELSNGFLEKVYENSLKFEIERLEYHVRQQFP